jgi:hypothetical protein
MFSDFSVILDVIVRRSSEKAKSRHKFQLILNLGWMGENSGGLFSYLIACSFVSSFLRLFGHFVGRFLFYVVLFVSLLFHLLVMHAFVEW